MTNIVLAFILLGLLLVLVQVNKKAKDTKGMNKLVKGWIVFSNIVYVLVFILFVTNIITTIIIQNF